MTDIERIKRILITVGTVGLVSGAYMSFSFGAAMSLAHGITLALLTVLAAVMFTAIDHLRRNGCSRGMTRALTTLAFVFLGAELFSHVGYSVGTRVENTELTGVQNVKYTDTREAVVDHKANLSLWQAQLAQLKWSGTVSADALRARLPGLELAIAQESKRGGCGPVCLQRTKERDDVQAQIGSAEAANDLSKRIEATQRLIDKSREQSAVTEFKSSPIVNQTKFVSQIATASLEPGTAALTWAQIAIGLLIALVTTFLPPFAFYLAFGDNMHKANPDQLTTGFSRGRAPDAETAARTRNMIVTEMVNDTQFADAVANINRRQIA